jgi:hypothetical protein
LYRWHDKFADYVQSTLELEMIHCVWHGGISIHNIKSKLIIEPEWLRSVYEHSCLYKKPSELKKLKALSNELLIKTQQRLHEYFNVKGNGGYEMFKFHLSWVANHEGQKSELKRLANSGNWRGFGRVYESEQSHNRHVKRLYFATNQATRLEIISEL